MPVRHNTGGEFPPGSGKKWLGVQFNNNDVLVNVYGGKYKNHNGKKRTQRFYGGRFKTMRPALESVIQTLQTKIKSGKYNAHEEKWGLKEKLERAQMQIKKYSHEVTEYQEEEGLRRLNITSRKRKTKSSRLQSTNPKKQQRVKKEFFVNASSGTLSPSTPSGLYVNDTGMYVDGVVLGVEEEPSSNYGETTYVTPLSMHNCASTLVFGEEIKFPMLPPKSPEYWADADGGGSEGSSMSRSCSPFYTPTPPPPDMLSALGRIDLPPKIVDVFPDELLPATPPLYVDRFDSTLESESSDVDMETDFLKPLSDLRKYCFNCRELGITCESCEQKDTFPELKAEDLDHGYCYPSLLFGEDPFMDTDFLKSDDEHSSDEEMMDVQLKLEPHCESQWFQSFVVY